MYLDIIACTEIKARIKEWKSSLFLFFFLLTHLEHSKIIFLRFEKYILIHKRTLFI